jgi:hypothetical protein
MTDAVGDKVAGQPWRIRPFLLALIGLIAAIVMHQLTDRGLGYGQVPHLPAFWRYALACGIGAGALSFGFGLERVRWQWSIAFGLAVGIVTGLVLYWSGSPKGGFSFDWPAASLFLSVVIMVPLFQAARDENGPRFPYAEVHGHAWTSVVLWGACWVFVGITFALAWLLAALFALIGLTFLKTFLSHDWAAAGLAGAAFGAALGLLRDRDGVVRLLQRVVTAVLAVLAPVLAIGLAFFLLALPFTGLHALWDATKATTPILLGCVIGALILANAVIGNGAEEELPNPVLRTGATILAACMLPLAIIAAIATGLRIGQYGFSPDRLWALVFVIFASAYGVAYWAALLRGRTGWAVFARRANLKLTFAIAGVALFVATPILSFNAISAHDQVARLESGKVTIDTFDWAALAFDFGDPGRAALKRLSASINAAVAVRARDVAKKDNRWEVAQIDGNRRDADALTARLRVLPKPVPVPQDLRALLTSWSACGDNPKEHCTLLFTPGATEAFAVRDGCAAQSPAGAPTTLIAADCDVTRYHLEGGSWKEDSRNSVPLTAAQASQRRAGLAAGQLEIRPVQRRQVFIGGVPVGDAFE